VCQRIGQLSRELETLERARTDLRGTGDAQTKTAAIADAGIGIRTAQRYEQLAGVDGIAVRNRVGAWTPGD
jgi:hypothetical protein